MASNNLTVTDKFSKMSLGNRDRVNDGFFQTRRTKLHENRREINDKINKELRMKAGARNLIDLTKDKKLKSKIHIEIDYFESNLKLWKEELEKANSALDTYQNMKNGLPMIPIAMKNTIEIDFTTAFRNVLSSHYGEEPDKYTDAINLINIKRKKIQKPQRNDKGLDDHISYLNLLCHAEKRFFFPDQSNGIIFSWNDIFTGVPFQQRTAIFEKCGIIFNLAALYSQLAAGKDKSNNVGLEEAQTYLNSAEACFIYLKNNFINSPSVDLRPELLNMLSGLMKTQALECKFLLLKKIKMNEDKYSNLRCLELVSESYVMSTLFDSVYSSLNIELLQYLDHVPQSWINLVQVKSNFYKALAYQILCYRYRDLSEKVESSDLQEDPDETIADLSKELKNIMRSTKYTIQLPTKRAEAIGLAKLLMNEALQLIEEAIKLAAMNCYLRNLDDLSSFLQTQHKQWIDVLHTLNKQESYDLLSCPELHIRPRNDLSTNEISLTRIMSARPEPDPFRILGPSEFFNSRNKFGQARTITIMRDQERGFGFLVKGNSPVRVINVERGSNADKAGLRAGDVVLNVGDDDVRWASQEMLVQLTSNQGGVCKLVVASVVCSPATSSGTDNCHLSLTRHNTVSGSSAMASVFSGGNNNLESSFNGVSNIEGMGTSVSSLKKGGMGTAPRLTWKQRLSGTLKRKKSNKHNPNQINSTLF